MPVQWKVQRVSGGQWRGRMTLPVVHPELGAVEPVTVDVLGWSPFGAIKKLASVAKSVVSSPLLRAVMPPQVSLAVNAFGALAKAAQSNRQVAAMLPGLSSAAASTLATMNRAANRPDANRSAPPVAPVQTRAALSDAQLSQLADMIAARMQGGGGGSEGG